MFHKEGQKIIFITLVIVVAIIFAIDYTVTLPWLRIALMFLALAFFGLILQFFRNPKRIGKLNDNHVLSPVDGKVVVIEEVQENEYFKDKRIQVSVFMSPINVHVTRYPIGGKVAFSKYHPGKFLVAWHPKASTDNERSTVVVENDKITILFRQIAGAVARRIITYAKENENVNVADEFGFIKFGSRVDLFFPIGTKINTKLQQKVIGGQSIIAIY